MLHAQREHELTCMLVHVTYIDLGRFTCMMVCVTVMDLGHFDVLCPAHAIDNYGRNYIHVVL